MSVRNGSKLAGLALLVALGSLTWAGAAGSASPSPVLLARAVSGVERAFFVRQAAIDTQTLARPQAPAAMAELFPRYGFEIPLADTSITLTALDAGRTRVCVRFPVNSPGERRVALRALADKGLTPADEQCNAVAERDRLLDAQLHEVRGIKILDTEDVPTATVLPAYPRINGIDHTPHVLPAIRLSAPAGQWGEPYVFTITNPAAPLMMPLGQPPDPDPGIMRLVLGPQAPDGTVTGLSNLSVREGFHVAHDCERLEPGQSCRVAVYYAGLASEAYRVGALRLDFATGTSANIGLLGVRRRD